MSRKNIILPVQPSLILNADGYREIPAGTEGISNFYEFYVQKGEKGCFEAVPDGSTDLVFGIGDADVKVYIGGTVLKVKEWNFEDGRYYFGVRFLPGRTILPEGLSIQEVVNTDVELSGNEYGNVLTKQLALAEGMRERVKILYRYLMESRRKQGQPCRLEEYMRSRLYETKGNIPIQMLSSETGYSECYIRRVFHQVHGISPKEFGRFVRFQALLNMLGRISDDISSEDAAQICGYYDQSHMIKDFKAFSGTTPEVYRKIMCDRKTRKEDTSYEIIKN